MVYSITNSPRTRKKPPEQLQSTPKETKKTKRVHANIKKAIHRRKLQEINENKRRALLNDSASNKDLIADEEADERIREAKQIELASFIDEMEKKYEDLEGQKHKLFMLLKVVLAEDEKKKQQEMLEKKFLEQKRAEEAAQLALTAPKEQQRRPNYYTQGTPDAYGNRGPSTAHQYLTNNRSKNQTVGVHKSLNAQPFTSLVPPTLTQHLQHAPFRHREPLLKDPPRPFFNAGFIGANPHLTQMAARLGLPPAQAQALAAMQLQQGLALPQLLHNSFANPHMRIQQNVRGDPRGHPSQRGRGLYW